MTIAQFDRVRPVARKFGKESVQRLDKFRAALELSWTKPRELKHKHADLAANFFERRKDCIRKQCRVEKVRIGLACPRAESRQMRKALEGDVAADFECESKCVGYLIG